MIAHHREIRGQIGELLSVCVVVLAGVQWHVDPGKTTQVPRPQTGRIDDELRLNVAPVRGYSAHTALVVVNIDHLYVFQAKCPALPGALDECRHHVHRTRMPVLGDPTAAHQPLGLEQWVDGSDFIHGDHVDPGNAESIVHGGNALQLLEARFAMGNAETAHLPEARRLLRLLLQLVDEPHGVFAQPGVALVGAHGADQSRSMPARATGELLTFQ